MSQAAGQRHRGRRGLPGPEGEHQLPRPAEAAGRHREPDLVRPAVLQRRRRHAEQAGRHDPVDVLLRPGRREKREFYKAPAGQEVAPTVSFDTPGRARRSSAGPAAGSRRAPARTSCRAAGCRSSGRPGRASGHPARRRPAERPAASRDLAPRRQSHPRRTAGRVRPCPSPAPRRPPTSHRPTGAGAASTGNPPVGRRSPRVRRPQGARCPTTPTVREVLARGGRGGSAARSARARSTMAEAVAAAFETGSTCSSRPAPAPASRWPTWCPALLHHDRVVVATATLALQHQLVERDIPALVEAVGRRAARAAVVRRAQGPLQLRLPAPGARGRARRPGRAGRDARRARWAPRCSRCASGSRRRPRSGGTGERDHAPRHTDRVWRQVSVSHRECLGAAKCPFGAECFAERAKERAARSAAGRHQPLAARDRRDRGHPDDPRLRRGGDRRGPRAGRPGHPGRDRRAVRRRGRADRATRRQRHVEGDEADDLADAAEALRDAIDGRPRPGRIDQPCRRAGRRAGAGARRRPRAGLGVPEGRPATTPRGAPGQGLGAGAVRDRRADGRRLRARRALDRRARAPTAAATSCCVAPLQVWGPMRDKLLADKTVVFTSATLKLGGDFDPVAGSVGLKPTERVEAGDARAHRDGAAVARARRRVAVRLPHSRRSSTSPSTCRRPGRDGLGAGPARRDRRPGRRRRRPHPRAVLLPPRRRGGRRGGPRAAAAPDHAGPGRRPAARAGPAVRRRPAHLPVRHAQPVAGPRRARARPASWCSSTGSRSRAPTTR